jgi:hypothetical protein
MNEYVLYTLAQVAITFAGFSGVVVAFRSRGAEAWSPTELRVLWFFFTDSFLVLFLALLPVALALATWPADAIWGLCNALLGSWFIIGNLLALRGEIQDRAKGQAASVPVITPILYAVCIIALGAGIALWLSAFDFIVRRGQAVFVLGLMTLLVLRGLGIFIFHRPNVPGSRDK